MNKTAASAVGVLIALMVSANGYLAGIIGNAAMLPLFHLTGLITVSLVIAFSKGAGTKSLKQKAGVPLWLNSGGLIGLIIILLNNRCFDSLGASLTLSMGIIGQTVGSLAADSTGFLGVQKYPFEKRKTAGLLLLFSGIALMTESWKGDLALMAMAFLAGLLIVLSMIINSRLAQHIGTFEGVRRNYLTGLGGALLLPFILPFSFSRTAEALSVINPLFIFGGGILGVLVVAGSNWILPRIPVIYTTLLVFGGQAVTGILIDYMMDGSFSMRKIGGVSLIIAGLLLNIILEKNAVRKPQMA